VLTPLLDEEIVCKNSFQTTGFFNLTREDERAYKELESDSIIKDMEIKLVPDSDYHPGCTFNEMYEQIEIWASRMKSEDCYFIIDRTKPFDFKVKTPSVLTSTQITTNVETSDLDTISASTDSTPKESLSRKLTQKDQERLDSLSEFIRWLEIQVNNEVKRQNMSWFIFDKSSLDCTKEDLFQALTDWEKNRRNKADYVWNVKGWSACNKLWNRPERKEICDIADNRRGRPSRKNQDRENIFKKFNIKISI